MYAFVCCCFAKRTSYNKETKREAESERRENERSQNIIEIKRRLRPILHQTQKICPFVTC